jgi:predicted aldo/keto reductase-like oxidoreductase
VTIHLSIIAVSKPYFIMSNINRRRFIRTGAAGTALALTGLPIASSCSNSTTAIDKVKLGDTGLNISRVAFGMGTHGWKHESNQMRIGMNNFLDLVGFGYDQGIRFFDTADTYGSHVCANEALKFIPREKVTVMSKIWTSELEWKKLEPVPKILDRIRKEINTDYLDICLMHCMQNHRWPKEKRQFMDDMQRAKDDGIIKKIGISAHNLDALKEAAESEWVDVILARINHVGTRMDDKPEKVMPVLEQARKNGKGILGMKLFGCGDLAEEADREKSLNYVIGSGNVHAMTIGFESVEQVKDTVERVSRIVSSS